MSKRESKGFQVWSCLIFGSINVIFFIILPITAFYMLQTVFLINLNPAFIITLLIFGSFQSLIAFIKNAFPKKTKIYNLLSIFAAIYSGVFLFYVFGGFGMIGLTDYYYLAGSGFEVLLGISIFAGTMILAAIVNTFYHLMRLIEVIRDKDFSIEFKRNFRSYHLKVRYFVRAGYVLIYATLFFFILSIIISGLSINFQVDDDLDITWDNNSTPFFYDDRLDLTSNFNLSNMGFYSVSDIYINVEIYTVTTDDPTKIFLPDNTKIGEINNVHYEAFLARYLTEESITVEVLPQYVPGMVQYNALLDLHISLKCWYAGIYIDFNTSVPSYWSKLI
ncbi:MAG: hypothetical protein ACTSSI_00685 [Candidatus Helarchaeota archaeon]